MTIEAAGGQISGDISSIWMIETAGRGRYRPWRM